MWHVFGLYLVILPIAIGLQCYSGVVYFQGTSLGTKMETCKAGESCYNMSVSLTERNKLSKLGCSSFRCFFAKNRCILQEFMGKSVQLCCCDGDGCNTVNLSKIDKLKHTVKTVLDIFG
ncbi:unnamed protein product, partial [Mesorhabditis belari]|uniref:Uncharacterized protein n=1 Tax=Mesorhabditis belari TaxID=2138241 RepID=A0AAF3ECQ1_9BILA